MNSEKMKAQLFNASQRCKSLPNCGSKTFMKSDLNLQSSSVNNTN